MQESSQWGEPGPVTPSCARHPVLSPSPGPAPAWAGTHTCGSAGSLPGRRNWHLAAGVEAPACRRLE